MKSFQLGPWAVHTELHEIVRDGESRRVGSKVMEALCCLADNPGRVVSKDELVERVWDGDFTSDEALAAVIYELRRALDDEARNPRFVETIRKRGYRLIAPVTGPAPHAEKLSPENPSSQIPSPEIPAKDPTAEPATMLPTSSPVPRRGAWLLAVAVLVCAVALALLTSRLRGGGNPEEAPGGIRSLAVLPVSSFSAEGSELAMAGALTDMLTADLAQACPLEVASGLSVGRDGSSWDLARVEAELGVDAVVESSVLRSGDRYWISVQLVETGTGRLLWGASYDRRGPDALAVLREVALDIALKVSGELPPDSARPSLD